LLEPRLCLCHPSKTLLRTKPIPTGTVFGNLEIDFVSFFSWEKFFLSAGWPIVKFIAKIQRRCLIL
jgi:hypothetical protein